MELETILYKDYEKELPQEGQHIIGQMKGDSIYVYQAFNPRICNYAITHQEFGGSHYNKNRMTWIKPNFLWMMFRSGWASKDNQERILAIELLQSNFEQILKEAVHSSYKEHIYQSRENWKVKLADSEVRLQWDPDHGPRGEKLTRRAIQLGLRGSILNKFIEEWTISITDITEFVKNEKEKLDKNGLESLNVIKEEKILISDQQIISNLELN